MPPRQRKDDQADDTTRQDAPPQQVQPDAETTDTVTDRNADTTNQTAHAERSETIDERSERWNEETHGQRPADRPQRGDY